MKKLIRRRIQALRSPWTAIEPLESRVLLSGSPGLRVTPADLEGNPPQASISAPPVTTAGQAAETVTITYASDASISLSTITISNISVTEEGTAGPATLAVLGVQASPNTGSPTSVIATYTV